MSEDYEEEGYVLDLLQEPVEEEIFASPSPVIEIIDEPPVEEISEKEREEAEKLLEIDKKIRESEISMLNKAIQELREKKPCFINQTNRGMD